MPVGYAASGAVVTAALVGERTKMVWRRARNHYDFAIRWWVRRYLRLGFIWRMAMAIPLTFVATLAALLVAGILVLVFSDSDSVRRFAGFLVGVTMLVSFFLPIFDYALELVTVGNDLNQLQASPSTIFATRAEYLGGHVNFPHGRFTYVTIDGQQANPYLTIRWESHPAITDPPPLHFPPWDTDFPSISLRDIDQADSVPDPDRDTMTLVDRRFGRFPGPRLALEINYTGPGSRRFTTELSNFWGGQEGIRALRNAIVCAVAEAEGEVPIKGPWKSLPLLDRVDTQSPEESDDTAPWRRPLPPEEYRRAFRRV